MTQVKVIYGQTLLDIAVQALGDAERAIEIAELNGLSVSDDLQSGQVLQVPAPDNDKTGYVQLFTDPANAPACADNLGANDTPLEGIDYWGIEVDFVVQDDIL